MRGLIGSMRVQHSAVHKDLRLFVSAGTPDALSKPKSPRRNQQHPRVTYPGYVTRGPSKSDRSRAGRSFGHPAPFAAEQHQHGHKADANVREQQAKHEPERLRSRRHPHPAAERVGRRPHSAEGAAADQSSAFQQPFSDNLVPVQIVLVTQSHRHTGTAQGSSSVAVCTQQPRPWARRRRRYVQSNSSSSSSLPGRGRGGRRCRCGGADATCGADACAGGPN
jgi:hypothetical protein